MWCDSLFVWSSLAQDRPSSLDTERTTRWGRHTWNDKTHRCIKAKTSQYRAKHNVINELKDSQQRQAPLTACAVSCCLEDRQADKGHCGSDRQGSDWVKQDPRDSSKPYDHLNQAGDNNSALNLQRIDTHTDQNTGFMKASMNVSVFGYWSHTSRIRGCQIWEVLRGRDQSP